MALLDEIKASNKASVKATPVEVSEWGKTLYVRPMTAGEYASVLNMAKKDRVRADFEMIRLTALDDQNRPVFTSPDDVADLQPAPVGKLLDAVIEANGFNHIAESKAESGTTPSN